MESGYQGFNEKVNCKSEFFPFFLSRLFFFFCSLFFLFSPTIPDLPHLVLFIWMPILRLQLLSGRAHIRWYGGGGGHPSSEHLVAQVLL